MKLHASVDWWEREPSHLHPPIFCEFCCKLANTVVPDLHPGRTRHFHVKYQVPHQPVLTTQHYFPDESENDRDSIFSPLLLLRIVRHPIMMGSYVTILDLA
jgi:hypothetical protein